MLMHPVIHEFRSQIFQPLGSLCHQFWIYTASLSEGQSGNHSYPIRNHFIQNRIGQLEIFFGNAEWLSAKHKLSVLDGMHGIQILMSPFQDFSFSSCEVTIYIEIMF